MWRNKIMQAEKTSQGGMRSRGVNETLCVLAQALMKVYQLLHFHCQCCYG